MIRGTYSDGHTSRSRDCELNYTDDGRISFSLSDLRPCDHSQLTISSRIANSPRYITLPDGGVFESIDNDAIDTMVSRTTGKRTGLTHRMESSLRIILATSVCVILFGFVFIRFGIPALSKELAALIPQEQARMLGGDMLVTLDEHLFEPSELPQETQQRYRDMFDELAATVRESGLKIAFRKSDAVGANALALPDGTVVFTDGIVELVEHDHEIAGIMLHEIGHIMHRHSLRIAIQSFSLAAFIAIISGDVSTSSSIITGLPVVLIESGYSRNMENEADDVAFDQMQRLGMDTGHFANLMTRLQATRDTDYLRCIKQQTAAQECLGEYRHRPPDDDGFTGYLSSHPGTQVRISRFVEHSRQQAE